VKVSNKWRRVQELDALEVFGYDGSFHTQDYVQKVNSLEVWEIDETCFDALRKNLPSAEVKVVDSFIEINRTRKSFDLIVIDNPTSTFGKHCEHFSLFPDVFRVLKQDGILIVNVIPFIDPQVKIKMPYLFNDMQLKMREDFYKTSNPENISFDFMLDVYRRLAQHVGFEMTDSFEIKRTFVHYLVMKFEKCSN